MLFKLRVVAQFAIRHTIEIRLGETLLNYRQSLFIRKFACFEHRTIHVNTLLPFIEVAIQIMRDRGNFSNLPEIHLLREGETGSATLVPSEGC